MTTFTNAAPAQIRPDPAKHVNYTYGMILGVDDFTQEFAYLAAKDSEVVSELAGYGRVRGLSVQFDHTAAGAPQLAVTPGLAYLPSGQPVLVDRAQCAELNAWLAANRADVQAGLGGGAPHSGPLELVVDLSYAVCETDSRPIPGEPCRSEDDLMAPSRLRDDFGLELHRPPPADQREAQALRAFVLWLRKVPVVESSSTTLADLLAAIMTASGVIGGSEAQQCPQVGNFMSAPPAAGLSIPSAETAAWIRAAFGLWAAELLPCWRRTAGGNDTLTLAHVVLNVLYQPLDDVYLIDPANPPTITQDDLPFLISQQVLQEWLFTVPESGPAGPAVVAAGWLDPTGAAAAAPFFTHGGLTAAKRPAPQDDVFDLHFTGFDATAHYLVTGAPVVADPAAAGSYTFEVAPPGADGTPAVRLRPVSAQPANLAGFQVQIVRYP
jgi:hypothetical protein